MDQRRKRSRKNKNWYMNRMILLLSITFLCMVGMSIAIYKSDKAEKKEMDRQAVIKASEEASEAEVVAKAKAEEALVSQHTRTDAEARELVKKFADENGIAASVYSQDLIDLLRLHIDAREFVLNYPLYYRGDESMQATLTSAFASPSDSDSFSINFDDKVYNNKVPNLYQWDPRWGYQKYGSDALGLTGCGPTSLSMVAMYLLNDKSLTPSWMANYSSENGYVVEGTGTSWTLMSEGATGLGLNVEELQLDEWILADRLQNGKILIITVGPGAFTEHGHYLVLTDYEGGETIDGKPQGGLFTINDPNCFEHSEKKWKFSEFGDQIDNIWAYSVN